MKKKIKFPTFKMPSLKITKYLRYKGTNSTNKNFYYTGLVGLSAILFFSLTPKLIILKNNLFVKSIEVQNESKNNLEKVLLGKSQTSEEQKDELNNIQVFEDIFQYEDIPTSTVRLDASTIKQLFKDTNYSLKNVIKLSLFQNHNLTICRPYL